jgi:hypothetical protein
MSHPGLRQAQGPPRSASHATRSRTGPVDRTLWRGTIDRTGSPAPRDPQRRESSLTHSADLSSRVCRRDPGSLWLEALPRTADVSPPDIATVPALRGGLVTHVPLQPFNELVGPAAPTTSDSGASSITAAGTFRTPSRALGIRDLEPTPHRSLQWSHEDMNLCARRIKRSAHGFTSLEHYRLRVLFHLAWDLAQVYLSAPRIRTRAPASTGRRCACLVGLTRDSCAHRLATTDICFSSMRALVRYF